ncbi:imidazole glycerol phosphate synthase, glutamine amidotransferase subunit [Candidatus Kaiserbacteria bacterium RIFCSPLOWO2_01_FULL_54_20]|uniref:Imidazole glycerol phosphate synthase subunit HisH n=1 Tax=Candidatus Kaiserbacteria bacterium RIFCSPLOWO2_01_FULL_54_20 TaxID=1798513 RepID=A0A1F6EJ53_9BACT|nr:MAG: imidazole glycerol phosphate synthase, glutamine amidotransferase subunit [Candidatus Kaiserbacteria bacterium RIFCSPLOWO2_01_FULL_54_20]
MKVAIIDYGAGNVRSVGNALETLGVSYSVITKPGDLGNADKVIVPGVGAAGSAMAQLRESGFAAVLPGLTVPVLGICLGLQLFADSSEENETKCLSILPGRVRKFRTELKVPQMGWNAVAFLKDSPLTAGIPDGSFFYFVHSYYLDANSRYVIGKASYDAELAAVVQKDNFYGTQFHPEKSGILGLKLLSNFCELC